MTSTATADGFTVEQKITNEQIAGLLCSGFEGGVRYWCRIMDYREPTVPRPWAILGAALRHPGPVACEYTDYPLLEGGAVVCRIDDDDQPLHGAAGDHLFYKPLVLDRTAIERGLTLMAQKWPRHWNNFVSENYDAETGDVFIQLCLLGDIVYG